MGVGIAFAFINSPANNAAVGALQKDQVGAGMGLFQGALYLGAGTGAGIIGAFLHARRDATESLNPLYTLDAIGIFRRISGNDLSSDYRPICCIRTASRQTRQ